MGQYAQIRLQGLFEPILLNFSRIVLLNFRVQFAKHSGFRFRSQEPIAIEADQTEKIHSLTRPPDGNLPGMKVETERSAQEIAENGDELLEKLPVFRNNDKVVGIPGIVSELELLLHELIEFIQVHIREELRGQIADRETLETEQG